MSFSIYNILHFSPPLLVCEIVPQVFCFLFYLFFLPAFADPTISALVSYFLLAHKPPSLMFYIFFQLTSQNCKNRSCSFCVLSFFTHYSRYFHTTILFVVNVTSLCLPRLLLPFLAIVAAPLCTVVTMGREQQKIMERGRGDRF